MDRAVSNFEYCSSFYHYISTKFDLLCPDSKIGLRIEQKQKIQNKDYRSSKSSWIIVRITKKNGKCTHIVVPELELAKHTNRIRKCVQNGETENDNPLRFNVILLVGSKKAVSSDPDVKKLKYRLP